MLPRVVVLPVQDYGPVSRCDASPLQDYLHCFRLPADLSASWEPVHQMVASHFLVRPMLRLGPRCRVERVTLLLWGRLPSLRELAAQG